jgi:D-arabinose 1-dehydrogenase-like Zn-dependent alcohol dehydrogenase
MLSVSMTGVKLGDRVAFIGVADAGRIAAIAAKVGLSGRAVALTSNDDAVARINRAAADAGVLVDTEAGEAMHLPFGDGAFDIVVVDDTGAMLEVARILRPGGRVLVIGGAEPTGLNKLMSKLPASPLVLSGHVNALLEQCGFGIVRTLAEREGLVFVEGLKPRTPVTS